MAWADVLARLKFYGPDGTPTLINTVPATSYQGPRSFVDAQKISKVGNSFASLWVLGSTFVASIALMPTMAAVSRFGSVAHAEASSPRYNYITAFLEKPPTKAELQLIPASANDVVIAKARITNGPLSFHSRHSGSTPLKYRYLAHIEIVLLLSGNARPGDRYVVRFGIVGGRTRVRNPKESLEKFVIAYLSEDGVRWLIDFPIPDEECSPAC